MMKHLSLNFAVVAVCLVSGLSACVSTADKPAVRSGDEAKKAFLLSDTADAFSAVSAADAKDCSIYARFIGLGLLRQSDAQAQTSKDVAEVWRLVLDRKTDAEKESVTGNSTERAEARENGTLDKLIAEKCITPVVAEMQNVF